MARALAAAALLFAVSACDESSLDACLPGSATASCASACAHLFDIGCRVGESVEECTATCQGSTAGGAMEYQAVLGCYEAASTCAEVDGCAMVCGPAGGPVVFESEDGGTADGGTAP